LLGSRGLLRLSIGVDDLVFDSLSLLGEKVSSRIFLINVHTIDRELELLYGYPFPPIFHLMNEDLIHEERCSGSISVGVIRRLITFN